MYVYVVKFEPAIRGEGYIRIFDMFEKAKNYIESIPYVFERYPGRWECFELGENDENLFKIGYYTINTYEVE